MAVGQCILISNRGILHLDLTEQKNGLNFVRVLNTSKQDAAILHFLSSI